MASYLSKPDLQLAIDKLWGLSKASKPDRDNDEYFFDNWLEAIRTIAKQTSDPELLEAANHKAGSKIHVDRRFNWTGWGISGVRKSSRSLELYGACTDHRVVDGKMKRDEVLIKKYIEKGRRWTRKTCRNLVASISAESEDPEDIQILAPGQSDGKKKEHLVGRRNGANFLRRRIYEKHQRSFLGRGGSATRLPSDMWFAKFDAIEGGFLHKPFCLWPTWCCTRILSSVPA